MNSRRSRGLVLPLFLAGLGVLLIVIGQLPLDQSPVPSLAPIPTPSQVAETESAAPATAEPTATPAPTPIPAELDRDPDPDRLGGHQRGHPPPPAGGAAGRLLRVPAGQHRRPGPRHERVHRGPRPAAAHEGPVERAAGGGGPDPDVRRAGAPLRGQRGPSQRVVPRPRRRPHDPAHSPGPPVRGVRAAGRELDGRPPPTTSGSRCRPPRATTATGASWSSSRCPSTRAPDWAGPWRQPATALTGRGPRTVERRSPRSRP